MGEWMVTRNNTVIIALAAALVIISSYLSFDAVKVSLVEEKQGLNLRAGPGKEYDKITGIAYKETVQVLQYSENITKHYGLQGKWAKVKYGPYEGWLFSVFLSNPKVDGYKININFLLTIILIVLSFIVFYYWSIIKDAVTSVAGSLNINIESRQQKPEPQKTIKVYDFNEETYEIGKQFETCIARIFANQKDDFTIVHWSYDVHTKHQGIYVEDDAGPDFMIRCKKTGTLFGVECKFRRVLYWSDRIDDYELKWSTQEQIVKYNNYSRKEKISVFIVIGLGRNPEKPDNVFCIPLKVAKYPKLFPSVFLKYKRERAVAPFSWGNGVLA